MKLKFPKNFMWGAALAAEEIEGKGITNKGKTVWDLMYEKDPKLFWDEIGPQLTCDFTRKYKEDIKMWAGMGANSVRIGVSWSRILPDGKTIDPDAIKLYHNIIDELNNVGITIVLNIFHFDTPAWAADLDGFQSREVIDKFVDFCRLVYKEYGNKVAYIATMNEPSSVVFGGYNSEGQWPMRKNDNQGLADAWFGTILAHAKAVKVYKEEFPNIKTPIGPVIVTFPIIPKDGKNFDAEDQVAAQESDVLYNQMWFQPMTIGKIPKTIWVLFERFGVKVNCTQEEINLIKSVKSDFLGLNYYFPIRKEKPDTTIDIKSQPMMEGLGKTFKWKDARMNVFRGWEMRPISLYEVCMMAKNDLENIPFYIGENGMGVEGEDCFRDSETKEIKDYYRIAFVEEHLSMLHKAIEDGAKCFGYHMWAMMDNWSWRNAFKNRYGFIEVDLSNQERRYKKSAHWLKEVSKNNGFEYDGKTVEDFVDLKTIKYNKSVNF